MHTGIKLEKYLILECYKYVQISNYETLLRVSVLQPESV